MMNISDGGGCVNPQMFSKMFPNMFHIRRNRDKLKLSNWPDGKDSDRESGGICTSDTVKDADILTSWKT